MAEKKSSVEKTAKTYISECSYIVFKNILKVSCSKYTGSTFNLIQ